MNKTKDKAELVCVNCPKGCRIEVTSEDGEIMEIDGYECPLGKDYAVEEFKNPTRVLPTTVRVKDGELPLVSVKSEAPIPKNKIGQAMNELAEIKVKAPVNRGDVVKYNVADTGVDMVATRSIDRENNKNIENKDQDTPTKKVC